MNLDTFFENFELFADAPRAVDKMRELMLELAVQGKLVEQKNSDGSAKELLQSVEVERAGNRINRALDQNFDSDEANQKAFAIPSNWEWAKLGQIALSIQYGYTASADHSLTEYRMLRITDIQDNGVDWDTVPGCQVEPDVASKYLLSPNDILIARTGGTIGKSFIVPSTPIKSVFASYLIRITPPKALLARYVKLFLESPLYWTQLRTMSAGTGQPNVNGQALGRLRIPLPPLAEQKRIVAKVDALMALCDRLEAQQRERDARHADLARASVSRFNEDPTPANLKLLFHPACPIDPADLRKTILTLAVRGKLVPQDPAEEGLRSQVTMKELSLQITDGEHATPIRVATGVPLATAKNVRDGFLDMKTTDFVEQATADKCWRRCKPQHNDILMVCVGATTGRVCLVQEPPEIVLVRSVALIRPNQDVITPKFLDLLLRSPIGQKQIWGNVKQSAQPCLYLGKISGIEFPLPPLAEQRRIVARVEELMGLVDQLEAQIAASRRTAVVLLEAGVSALTN
jgi:type I restriction enzyme S subunit